MAYCCVRLALKKNIRLDVRHVLICDWIVIIVFPVMRFISQSIVFKVPKYHRISRPL